MKQLLNNRYFLKWATLGLLVFSLTTALAGALGIIYLRQQKSRTAEDVAGLQVRLHEIELANADLAARIAEAHQPHFLTRGLSPELRPTEDTQIVWVPRGSLNRPRGNPAVPAPQSDSPLSGAWQLAFIDAEHTATE